MSYNFIPKKEIIYLYATSHKESIFHLRLAVFPANTNVIGRATKVNHLPGRIADTNRLYDVIL